MKETNNHIFCCLFNTLTDLRSLMDSCIFIFGSFFILILQFRTVVKSFLLVSFQISANEREVQ